MATMSSAGRSPRGGDGRDEFATPPWPVRMLAAVWQPPPGILVEPHAGCGSIIRAWPEWRSWLAIEREERCRARLLEVASEVWIGPFHPRRVVPPLCRVAPAAIIANPPWSTLDLELALMRKTCLPLAMLARASYLTDGDGRRARFRADPPELIVDVGRVDFETHEQKMDRRRRKAAQKGVPVDKVPISGGDSSGYSWFVWAGSPQPSTVTRYLVGTRPGVEERRERGEVLPLGAP
jgi:hypothetical protein